MEKDFEEALNEMSDIIDRQRVGVESYIKELKDCVVSIAKYSDDAEKNADVAAVTTHLSVLLNRHKFCTKMLSVISRKLERYFHDFTDECLDALEISKN